MKGTPMKREDRALAEKLESVMTKHQKQTEVLNVGALHDLNAAGYEFDTIDEAYLRLDAQRRYPGFTQTQIDIVMYQEAKARRAAERSGKAA